MNQNASIRSESQVEAPRWFLYLATFIAGLTTLGVEMATSRLIGAVLGTSDLVWAAVIALVLVYLTAGYFLGGKLADRRPRQADFFRLMAWAALTAGLLPIFVRPLMLQMAAAFALADLNLLVLGAVGLTVAILFAVSVTLLGCVSPYVIRLALTDVDTAGATVGRLYALSTTGSIVGTFAPALLMIPAAGTAWTFAILAGTLLAVGLVGLFWVQPRRAWRLAWMPVALLAALALVIRGPVKPAPAGTRLLYEAETQYNYVQVVEVEPGVIVSRQQPGTRLLLLNEGQGVHSVYHPDILQTQATWDMFLAAPYFNPPPYGPASVDRVAIIGLAAGTIARQYTEVYGPLAIDGIEIDPGIVEAGRRYFGMTMPNLNVMADDGRYGLSRLAGDYDLIAIDAYRVPYIPWHLTTVEFFEETRSHLASDGVVMINVGRAASDRRLVDAMAATLLRVFPSVHAIDVPYSFNTMLVGTLLESDPANLTTNLNLLPAETHPLLRDTLSLAAQAIVTIQPSSVVFTDDQAPVETLINTMIFEFVTGLGNLDQVGD